MARVLGLFLVVVACALAGAAAAAQPPNRPLETGIMDPDHFPVVNTDAPFRLAEGTGAHYVRLGLTWAEVAPGGVTKPAFDATNPFDPAYFWNSFDKEVTYAVDHGFQPIVSIQWAPQWAQDRTGNDGPVTTEGIVRPDPAAFADFARAAATRYNGNHGLPRVRYWQAWNEPNISFYLAPEYVGEKLFGPMWYRSMLNAFSTAVHDVDPTNVVIAGGLAPYGSEAPAAPGVPPLTFMRAMLCMSAGAHPKPTCSAHSSFDIWSTHPYTWGGPTHSAYNRNDVALGDLSKVKALLDAAVAAHHVTSSDAVRFWVTEFSWDSNPPDPKAVPIAIQTRWVSQALYEMWNDGVSMVTWFLLEDESYPDSPYQSGLYTIDGKPKPTLQAFRFPFVALPSGSGTLVWGRTPTSTSGHVVVEQKVGGTWRLVVTLNANRFGIFQTTVPLRARTGYLRARIVAPTATQSAGDISLPFGLKAVPDKRYPPFGG